MNNDDMDIIRAAGRRNAKIEQQKFYQAVQNYCENRDQLDVVDALDNDNLAEYLYLSITTE
jgi:hypothetical protein